MNFKINDIKLFSDVAKFQNFSEAALHLNVPQPSISRRIKTLEEQTGQRLFIRHHNYIKLNEFGNQFLDYCHNMIEANQQASDFAKYNSNTPHGQLTIEALSPIIKLLIGPFLQQFQQTYPDINLEFKEIPYNSWKDPLKSDIRLHTHLPNDEGLISRIFINSYRSFYASPMLLKKGVLIHPKQLSTFPCIVTTEDMECGNTWQYVDSAIEHNIYLNKMIHLAHSANGLDAARHGIGVSWNYKPIVNPSINNGEVQELFDGNYRTPASAFVIFRERRLIPRRERVFIDQLLQFFQTQQYA